MRRAFPLVLIAVLAGCSQSPAPRLYVLAPTAAAIDSGTGRVEPVVAVVRVQLPDYLNRSQMVSRSGTNSLAVDEDNRWAEPLDRSVPRILAENLSNHLPGVRVIVPQESRGRELRYEYLVALDAYEADGRGGTVMQGRWHLRDSRSRQVVLEGRIDDRKAVASDAPSAIVAAMNQNLDEVSRQIAAATAGRVGRR